MSRNSKSQHPRSEQQVRDADHALSKIFAAIGLLVIVGAGYSLAIHPRNHLWTVTSSSLFLFAYGLRFVYLLRRRRTSVKAAAVLVNVTVLVFAPSSLASIGAVAYESLFPYALLIPISGAMAAREMYQDLWN